MNTQSLTMRELKRGQKSKLSDLGLGNCLRVGISIKGASGQIYDVSCFGVDAREKLSDEQYMVFYNQPVTPCGGLSMRKPPEANDLETFDIDLSKLPGSIDKLVFAVNIDGNGRMSQIEYGEIRLFDSATQARFRFEGSDFQAERAVIIAEIYRKDNNWRCAAVGQGFNGGLAMLLTHFGGQVADPTPPPPVFQPPPPVPVRSTAPPPQSTPPPAPVDTRPSGSPQSLMSKLFNRVRPKPSYSEEQLAPRFNLATAPPGAVLEGEHIYERFSPSVVTLRVDCNSTINGHTAFVVVSENGVLADKDNEPLILLRKPGKKAIFFKQGLPLDSIRLGRMNDDTLIASVGNDDQPRVEIVDDRDRVVGRISVTAEPLIGSGTGSGFFVEPDIVATNCHVIEGTKEFLRGSANITDSARVYDVVSLIVTDEDHDLALLYVPGTGASHLSLRHQSSLKITEAVFALGTPLGLEGTLTAGTLSSTKLRSITGPEPVYLQHTAAIDRGSSGGPLFNKYGEVVGVNAALLGNDGAVRLAVASQFLIDLLSLADVRERIAEEKSKRRR